MMDDELDRAMKRKAAEPKAFALTFSELFDMGLYISSGGYLTPVGQPYAPTCTRIRTKSGKTLFEKWYDGEGRTEGWKYVGDTP